MNLNLQGQVATCPYAPATADSRHSGLEPESICFAFDFFPTQIEEGGEPVKLKVVVHEAEEGGYWAEVPAVPGCATQGDTFEELLSNLYEAVEGCLSVDIKESEL